MKWVAFFSGELNNAATYFSSFANLSTDTMKTANGKLGEGTDCTWRPWKYKERIENVKTVDVFKKSISHFAKSTQRTKVLNYMKSIGTRQEEVPIIGKLVDKIFAEALHNGNNAFQNFFNLLLAEAKQRSMNIPSNTRLWELPQDCILKKFILRIKHKVGAGRLYKKVCKWLKGGMKGNFEFQFTGKETKKVCFNFMYLVDALTKPNESPLDIVKVIAFTVVGTELRESISLFSRVEMSQEDISFPRERCKNYFNGYFLFLLNITPTMWTIGHCIPYHTQLLYDKFRLGLGLNTMQEREQKHINISNYAKHSTSANRWDLVFRHEFVSSIWLQEHDPLSEHYKHMETNYVPARIQKPELCFCSFPKEADADKCKYCSPPLFDEVFKSISEGKYSHGTERILGPLASC